MKAVKNMKNMKDNIILKEETVKVKVKKLEIEYQEKYAVDKDTGEEIYVREIEIENDINLYNIFKSEKGLLTSNDIKSIRDIYSLSQTDFSKIIGLGAITIHRYENGTIQTEANNSIIEFCKKASNMIKLIIKNCEKIDKTIYHNLYIRVKELIEIENHKIIKSDISHLYEMGFSTSTALDVSKVLLKKIDNKFDGLTQISLQKLCYYIQGISLLIFDKPAYDDSIYNLQYGPVVKNLSFEYKKYGANIISLPSDIPMLSDGLNEIIDIVVENYGKISAWSLVELTHEEDPWSMTNKDEVIKNEIIREYFKKVYN